MEDISSNYMCFSTAKELWDNVNEMYSDLKIQSQIYELQLILGEVKQGGDMVTTYFFTLKRIWQDLDLFHDYKCKSLEDCVHYQQLVDNNRVFRFLAGLNVEFDEVRGRIVGRQRLSSINEAFAEVRREETRRSLMLGKKIQSFIIRMKI